MITVKKEVEKIFFENLCLITPELYAYTESIYNNTEGFLFMFQLIYVSVIEESKR